MRALLLLPLLWPAPARALFSQAPAAVRARATEADCAPLGVLGCWYAPPAAQRARTAPLLIYHRGFHPALGRVVPPARATESARQAFSRFRLAETAEAAGAVLFVTASSPVFLKSGDLAALEAATGLTLSPVFLAAHSGGYEGLGGTLDAVPAPERLIMLDDFYFGPELAAKIGAAAEKSRVCAGYFTTWKKPGGESNEDRLKRMRKLFPASCLFENQDKKGHDDGVTLCLGTYLSGRRCP